MSALLGVLSLTGKGGSRLFVYDDCLIRSTPGILDAVTGAPVPTTAEDLLAQHADNRMVRLADVATAELARGRWPARGLRRLTVTLRSGTVVRYEWPGDGATRSLNDDATTGQLLRSALGDRFQDQR